MSLTLAAALASTLSFVAFALIGVWYLAPWLRIQGRAEALTALLWVHAFRHVALQIFSAQRAGFVVSAAGADHIMYGDVVGAVLAVTAIVLLPIGCRAPLQSSGCSRSRRRSTLRTAR